MCCSSFIWLMTTSWRFAFLIGGVSLLVAGFFGTCYVGEWVSRQSHRCIAAFCVHKTCKGLCKSFCKSLCKREDSHNTVILWHLYFHSMRGSSDCARIHGSTESFVLYWRRRDVKRKWLASSHSCAMATFQEFDKFVESWCSLTLL